MVGDERLRLFVAVDVPDHHLDAANLVVEPLRRQLSAGRWTRKEGQHVTLKFLGWTPSDRLEAVRGAIAAAASRTTAGRTALGALGAFPSPRRARVLWIGLVDDDGVLARLAADLDRSLEPLGFPTEQRAFTPHLTLARFKTPARLPQPLPVLEASGSFVVSAVKLYRSRLHPHGARYEVVDSFPLRAT